ncbi:sensor histidine kinase [Janthinobacterium sp.]|uniref:sensor histidine kinase n=1 Tax=Janthinobacterium sp. TaxID=1871054 RepID=UPI00293D82EA|nr:sensor histidine kinase [Janthinobacterium sp.]
MRFPPLRIFALCGAGCALALPAQAAAPGGAAFWHPGGAAAALLLLGCAAAAMLWRWRRRHDALDCLRGQLRLEQALRDSAEQALRNTHASLCKMVALQDGIKENERRRIGRDIHDDLGQNLLALKIDISMLQVSGAGMHPQLQLKLGMIAANIELTIQSLRCIINDLRPTALEAGLKAAVERQLSEFSRISGIACSLDAAEGALDDNGDAALDTMLLRVLQESLSNIARHAKASAVTVTLRRAPAGISMIVRDNGVGMPAGQLPCGCGLLGIRDRVAAAGGQFSIDSRPGQGTALSLSIPLPEAVPAG